MISDQKFSSKNILAEDDNSLVSKEVKKRKIEGRIGLLIIAVLALFLAYWIRQGLKEGVLLEPEKGRVQAVFLDNGEVYFGEIVYKNQAEVVLRNIYYLQVLKSLQYNQDKDTSRDISLVKLGKELHGPLDEMRINRFHIIYIEDLRNDSKVVQAIEEYEQ